MANCCSLSQSSSAAFLLFPGGERLPRKPPHFTLREQKHKVDLSQKAASSPNGLGAVQGFLSHLCGSKEAAYQIWWQFQLRSLPQTLQLAV